jgi:hypothetical protein
LFPFVYQHHFMKCNVLNSVPTAECYFASKPRLKRLDQISLTIHNAPALVSHS